MTIWQQMRGFLIATDDESQLIDSQTWMMGRQTSMAPANTSREESDWARGMMHQTLLLELYLGCQRLVVVGLASR